MSKYWEESVEIALEEEGVTATKDQVKNIAGSISISHENYGMAHGYDSIPNPRIFEESEKVKLLKEEIEQLKKQIECYRKSVAVRRNVPLEDVYLENGRVIYGRA